MLLPTAVFLLLIFVTAAVYCWKGRYCPREHKKQRISITISLSLLQLVKDVQRHRGMSMAIISKDRQYSEAFNQEISTTGKEIQYSLKNLQEHYEDNQRILTNDQWQALLHKWTTLKACWRDLDFISNLFAHNEVINEIIDIIEKLAEKEHSRLGKERTQLLLHWPQLIEHLGMIRALGVYALSSEAPNSLMNISLTMADHRQKAQQILAHERRRIRDKQLLDNSETVLRDVDEMLQNNETNQSVKSFYDDMTRLIDSWYACLNQRLDRVDFTLQYN